MVTQFFKDIFNLLDIPFNDSFTFFGGWTINTNELILFTFTIITILFFIYLFKKIRHR